MPAKYLWELGSVIILLFGCMHLYFTFFTDKFSSTNKQLIADMKASSPKLTKQTTMWKAWIGFNATHSSGAMFIGFLNFYMAYNYFDLMQTDHIFFLLSIVTVVFYVWVIKNIGFKTPIVGVLFTLFCYIAAYVLVLIY